MMSGPLILHVVKKKDQPLWPLWQCIVVCRPQPAGTITDPFCVTGNKSSKQGSRIPSLFLSRWLGGLPTKARLQIYAATWGSHFTLFFFFFHSRLSVLIGSFTEVCLRPRLQNSLPWHAEDEHATVWVTKNVLNPLSRSAVYRVPRWWCNWEGKTPAFYTHTSTLTERIPHSGILILIPHSCILKAVFIVRKIDMICKWMILEVYIRLQWRIKWDMVINNPICIQTHWMAAVKKRQCLSI